MPNNSIIPLHQSQLYKLTSPRRLADVLGLGEAELRAMAIGPDRYRQFEIEKKGGGTRPVEDPVAPLKREIGRAHVCTPVTNAQIACRLLREKKNREDH